MKSGISTWLKRATFGVSRRLIMVLGSVLCFFVAAGMAVNTQTQKELHNQRLVAQVTFWGEFIVDLSAPFVNDGLLSEIDAVLETVSRHPNLAYAYFLDTEGARLASATQTDRLQHVEISRGQGTATGSVIAATDDIEISQVHAVSFPIIRDGEKLGTLQLGLDLKQFDTDLQKVQYRNIVAGAVFVSIGIWLCILVSRSLTRPLNQLIHHTKRAAGGDFDQSIKLSTNDELEKLANSFNIMMGTLRGSMKTVHSLAYRDSLTGLPNRAWFKMHFEGTVDSFIEEGRSGAILFLDVDRFKQVNDTLGHSSGDRLLRDFAKRITASVEKVLSVDVQNIRPNTDPVASEPDYPAVSRLGGDEFVIVIPQEPGRPDAESVAREIISSLKIPFALGGAPYTATTSIGIALFSEHGFTSGSLLKNADAAMYQAKKAGRNQYKVFDAEITRMENERIELESELKVALEEDQLCVFFQPQFSVETGELVGAEALVRWQHPSRGLLTPGDFLPVADSLGLMPTIGRKVIQMSLDHARTWPTQSDGNELQLAVNSSIPEIEGETYVDFILSELERTEFAAERFNIEVTESTAMFDNGEIELKLQSLREAGIRFAVDDFGIGYSNLARLKDLNFEILKIDQSLMRDVGLGLDAEILFSTILNMCQDLNLQVVAEGIENRDQLEFLKLKGCDFAQGFSLARPMEAVKFAQFAVKFSETDAHEDEDRLAS